MKPYFQRHQRYSICCIAQAFARIAQEVVVHIERFHMTSQLLLSAILVSNQSIESVRLVFSLCCSNITMVLCKVVGCSDWSGWDKGVSFLQDTCRKKCCHREKPRGSRTEQGSKSGLLGSNFLAWSNREQTRKQAYLFQTLYIWKTCRPLWRSESWLTPYATPEAYPSGVLRIQREKEVMQRPSDRT